VIDIAAKYQKMRTKKEFGKKIEKQL